MIILDTHAWIWWMNESEKLSKTALQAIYQAKRIGISSMSCLEIATLVAKNRLKLNQEVLFWIKQALAVPKSELLPLSPEIAVQSTQLGDHFHSDPADQVLVATTLEYKASLVTKDEKITSSKIVEVIW